mmetsp:Transcript_4363/g.11486  ORF Transcript_4363/g.11486 Transcript_4363/m.11486 type:complete len:220 (+) Transcript_4363:59-718(+)
MSSLPVLSQIATALGVASVSALAAPQRLKGIGESLAPLLSLSWGVLFGSQVWVSLVSGITMFRTVPRHTFGKLQSKLFPAYFQLSTICSSLLTIATAALMPSNRLLHTCAGLSLASSLVNLVYLEPQTTATMYERHAIERELGIGVSMKDAPATVEMAKANTELQRLNKKFGMYHGISSLSNLIGLVALFPFAWAIKPACLSVAPTSPSGPPSRRYSTC